MSDLGSDGAMPIQPVFGQPHRTLRTDPDRKHKQHHHDQPKEEHHREEDSAELSSKDQDKAGSKSAPTPQPHPAGHTDDHPHIDVQG